MTTINAKIRNQANKIIAKYNGYRKPQDIAKIRLGTIIKFQLQ